jgi:hypothetical protein
MEIVNVICPVRVRLFRVLRVAVLKESSGVSWLGPTRNTYSLIINFKLCEVGDTGNNEFKGEGESGEENWKRRESSGVFNYVVIYLLIPRCQVVIWNERRAVVLKLRRALLRRHNCVLSDVRCGEMYFGVKWYWCNYCLVWNIVSIKTFLYVTIPFTVLHCQFKDSSYWIISYILRPITIHFSLFFYDDTNESYKFLKSDSFLRYLITTDLLEVTLLNHLVGYFVESKIFLLICL